jgi:ribosome-associated heat shock protein Hsp15
MRLDAWLDIACLFKSRSLAQAACRGGKVEVNGQAGKPSRELHAGDELRITRSGGRRQVVVVRDFAEHHVARAAARELYEDRTPPASAEEIEERRLRRAYGAPLVTRRPANTKQRRALRRLKRESS